MERSAMKKLIVETERIFFLVHIKLFKTIQAAFAIASVIFHLVSIWKRIGELAKRKNAKVLHLFPS